MSVEELLKPRYKVIADYPNSNLVIGEILTSQAKNGCNWETDKHHYLNLIEPWKFPAIFRKLEWWEYRDEKDMPKYVIKLDDVLKINKYDLKKQLIFTYFHNVLDYPFDFKSFLKGTTPATEAEYLNYIKTITK
jgi:hypothetical protein